MSDNASVAQLTEVRTRTVAVFCHSDGLVNAPPTNLWLKTTSTPHPRSATGGVPVHCARIWQWTGVTLGSVSVFDPEGRTGAASDSLTGSSPDAPRAHNRQQGLERARSAAGLGVVRAKRSRKPLHRSRRSGSTTDTLLSGAPLNGFPATMR